MVQANTRLGVVETGHSVLYFNKGQHELMRDAEGSIDTIYQAKYSKAGYRNYIYSHTPSRAQLSFKIQHMIKKRVLFVLDDKYSQHITRAFEEERLAFTRLPYSYGMRYNCHRFALEILNRLQGLSE